MNLEDKKISYEAYTIILKHEVFDGEKYYQLEEPLIIKELSIIPFSDYSSIVLNEMMDKLKHELISRYENAKTEHTD